MNKYKKIKAGEKLPKSNYKGVCARLVNGNAIEWNATIRIDGKKQYSTHSTEREAAKRYDMYLIRDGREPVNVLTKVTEKEVESDRSKAYEYLFK